jgi:hypothetical protein
MEATAKPELKAAIAVVASTGLRVGRLTGLSINRTRWSTTSEGKDRSGKVPEVV